MPKRNPFRIAEFARFGEPVEVKWLGRIVEKGGDWMIAVTIQLLERNERRDLLLPFGLAPELAPGRIYVDGLRGPSVGHGIPGSAIIPKMRECDVVPLGDLPGSVFPNGKPPRSAQPILRYRLGDRGLYVPPIELIRRLFLFEKSLAYAILRIGGLWDLVRYEDPGYFDEHVLHFTEAMPLKALSQPFVRKLAWIVFQQTGQRAWRSVAQNLTSGEWPLLDPPAVSNSRWTYRALVGDNAELILEIIGLTLSKDPVKRLGYEHPLDRHPSRMQHGPGAPESKKHDGTEKSAPVEKHFVVEDDGSRRNVRQDVVDLDHMLSDFDDPPPKITRLRPEARTVRGAGADHHSAGDDDVAEQADQDTPKRHKTINVSISDISATGALQPIAFRLLEVAPPGYEGELGPLIDTLRRMRTILPSVKISGTPCVLPGERPVTRVGPHRRLCMIATFECPAIPLTVLLDVDHAQGLKLSALKISAAGGFTEMEHTLHQILTSMTDKNGHWPQNLEHDFDGSVEIERIPKLLRKDIRMDDNDYQTKWAAMLAERLGLEGLMAL